MDGGVVNRGGGGGTLATGLIIYGLIVNGRVNDTFAFIFLFWVVIRCCMLQGHVLYKSFR